jgi:hypothetical protein
MTAPLPPLPKQYKVLIEQSDESGVWTKQHIAVWRIREMQDFAKLAVREALERIVKNADRGDGWIEIASEDIEAMLKEYE